MTEQLALLDVAVTPKLTHRQQAALDALAQAGADGLEASEVGALLHELKADRWSHNRNDRCRFCPQTGNEVLKALAAKGLARYRRKTARAPGAWLYTGNTATIPEPQPEVEDGVWEHGKPVPYGIVPF